MLSVMADTVSRSVTLSAVIDSLMKFTEVLDLIKNFRYLNRTVLYTNMKVGKMSPMDGDAILDLFGKGMMFFEVKCRYAPMSIGQRLCLQNLVSNTRDDRMAVAVLCDCPDSDANHPIDLAACSVRQVYENGEWVRVENTTVREYTDEYTKRVCDRFGLKTPQKS